MKTHILSQRLIDLQTKRDLIQQIKDFLCSRPQRVCASWTVSDMPAVCVAHQGCLLPPVLFFLYKNESMVKKKGVSLFKYVEDMTLAGLLQKTDSVCDWIFSCWKFQIFRNFTRYRFILFFDDKPQAGIKYIHIQIITYYFTFSISNTIHHQLCSACFMSYLLAIH